jgi:hypothetical protein
MTPRPPRMTRKQLCEWLTSQGYPMSESQLEKLCSWKVNQGPPASVRFGGRLLYDPDEALEWAEKRCRAVTQSAA